METLFEKGASGGTNAMILQMRVDILVKQGEKEKALAEMEQLVDSYIKLAENEKGEVPVYFDKLEWTEGTSLKKEYLLENLLWILETEEAYAGLREEEAYRNMVRKIQTMLGKGE